LVAGALDYDPQRWRDFALSIGIEADRAYDSYQEMIKAEALRPDKSTRLPLSHRTSCISLLPKRRWKRGCM
jgi:hypothetical protein